MGLWLGRSRRTVVPVLRIWCQPVMVAIVWVNVSAILVFGFALRFTQTMLPQYKIVGCLWRNVGLGLALRHPTYCELEVFARAGPEGIAHDE